VLVEKHISGIMSENPRGPGRVTGPSADDPTPMFQVMN